MCGVLPVEWVQLSRYKNTVKKKPWPEAAGDVGNFSRYLQPNLMKKIDSATLSSVVAYHVAGQLSLLDLSSAS